MIPPENLLAFTLAAAVIVVMPGPSVLFTIGRALALGRVGGLLSVLGNALGMLPLIVAVAFGVGGIVAQSVVLFTAVKIAGSLYLVFLGVQAIRHRGRAAAQANGALPRSAWRQLSESFVVGVTNPKTIAFFVAVLPQFVDVGAGAVPLQMLQLGLVFVALALACDSVWALAAAQARTWFGRSPQRIATLSATGGGLMIGLGGILLFTGNEH
ncbi:LysE family translocator [Microbacterium sp. CPCC 204701]|uniref:LysE family translocator n=1 Tax=Microbacterium sp. CPCC 204701 TaxID=2493084 RepID=UPI000FD8B63D|nr:LysE family translocator [Microbacterium sp. CPCC 204701]